MYNDGSILQRLREMQRETDAAYARVHYVHNLLRDVNERNKFLETRIKELEEQIEVREAKTNDSKKPSKNKKTPKEV
jgi:predicted  nucleic acid-binding Zn-ribbon protein